MYQRKGCFSDFANSYCVEIYLMQVFAFEMHDTNMAGEYYPHYMFQNFHNDPNTPALKHSDGKHHSGVTDFNPLLFI